MKTKRDPAPSGSAASTLQSVTRSVLTPTPPPPQRPTAPPSQRPTAPPSQRPTAPLSQRPTAPPQRHAAPPQRHAAPPSKAPPSQKPATPPQRPAAPPQRSAAPPQMPAAPPSKATKATQAPWGSGALAVKSGGTYIMGSRRGTFIPPRSTMSNSKKDANSAQPARTTRSKALGLKTTTNGII